LESDDTYTYFLKIANHNNLSLSDLCGRVRVDEKFMKYCLKFNFKNNCKCYMVDKFIVLSSLWLFMNLCLWLIIIFFLLTTFASGLDRLNRNKSNDEESKDSILIFKYSWKNFHLCNILARLICFEAHSKHLTEKACLNMDL
jgi:hypothetical protein